MLAGRDWNRWKMEKARDPCVKTRHEAQRRPTFLHLPSIILTLARDTVKMITFSIRRPYIQKQNEKFLSHHMQSYKGVYAILAPREVGARPPKCPPKCPRALVDVDSAPSMFSSHHCAVMCLCRTREKKKIKQNKESSVPQSMGMWRPFRRVVFLSPLCFCSRLLVE